MVGMTRPGMVLGRLDFEFLTGAGPPRHFGDLLTDQGLMTKKRSSSAARMATYLEPARRILDPRDRTSESDCVRPSVVVM